MEKVAQVLIDLFDKDLHDLLRRRARHPRALQPPATAPGPPLPALPHLQESRQVPEGRPKKLCAQALRGAQGPYLSDVYKNIRFPLPPHLLIYFPTYQPVSTD